MNSRVLQTKPHVLSAIPRDYIIGNFTARKNARVVSAKRDYSWKFEEGRQENTRRTTMKTYEADILKASPSQAPIDTPSPRKRKLDAVSGSSSSLSETSPLASPLTAPPPLDPESARPSPSPSTSSDGVHQPPPAASIAQYQTFGPNPLTFDDPTIYEIRPVTDDMTDEEKKDIYCVASFPHDDLHDLIAVPRGGMDKDFSNAVKPNNQVAAHTFTGYLDNYLRSLKEEDIGFLNERVSSGEEKHIPMLKYCRVIG